MLRQRLQIEQIVELVLADVVLYSHAFQKLISVHRFALTR